MKRERVLNYLEICDVVAKMSPDEERKVGALLVNEKTLALLSSGYNGFLRGTNSELLPKKKPYKHEYMIHAEANLLLNCSKHGITTEDCVLFCSLSPCVNCTRLLW